MEYRESRWPVSVGLPSAQALPIVLEILPPLVDALARPVRESDEPQMGEASFQARLVLSRDQAGPPDAKSGEEGPYPRS